MTNPKDLASDIYRGAGSIATLMYGIDTRQNRGRVYRAAERQKDDRPPFFKENGVLCLRGSAYLAWITRRESASQAEVAPAA